MRSAVLAVRLLVLALAAYLIFEGLPALQKLRQARRNPPKPPPEFEWVDKTKGLRILHFYATPGAIRRGQEVSLCYGVAQAAKARIEAEPGGLLSGVWPTFNRCLIVTPRRDTRYTLTAEDDSGARRQLSLEVTVLPPEKK
ncbi:MAG: hypothetical protein HXY18_04420 [Bryobacteraceae bacterium]|nr:hypothetical protein [Bryobacteraceae bacterium]